MSALSRVAVDNHKHISVEKGDTVVLSSRIIPGNEKAIFRMIDHMSRRGADVMYGSMNPPLHVSGHGSIEEMKLVLNLVPAALLHADPRRVPPAFQARPPGRAPALRRPEETFVMDTGDVLEIDHQGARKAGKVTVGRVCIDSGSVDDVVQEMVIRDRRHLSEDGIVLPIIAINRHTGRMESPPEIVMPRLRGRPRTAAISSRRRAAVVAQDSRRLQPGGEDGLGSHEGEDPRRPEAPHREADLQASADHAGDSGSLRSGRDRTELRVPRRCLEL